MTVFGERSAPARIRELRRAILMFGLLFVLWWIVELLPKRMRDPANNWAERWIIPLGRHRLVWGSANIHRSVFDRQKSVPSYNPPNLPAKYEVIPG